MIIRGERLLDSKYLQMIKKEREKNLLQIFNQIKKIKTKKKKTKNYFISYRKK